MDELLVSSVWEKVTQFLCLLKNLHSYQLHQPLLPSIERLHWSLNIIPALGLGVIKGPPLLRGNSLLLAQLYIGKYGPMKNFSLPSPTFH